MEYVVNNGAYDAAKDGPFDEYVAAAFERVSGLTAKLLAKITGS